MEKNVFNLQRKDEFSTPSLKNLWLFITSRKEPGPGFAASRPRHIPNISTRDIAFQFDQNDAPLGSVIDLSEEMNRVPPAELLRARFLMDHYDESVIRRYLSYLSPTNMLMTVTGAAVPTRQTTPWYAAPYAVAPIESGALARYARPEQQPAFELPKP